MRFLTLLAAVMLVACGGTPSANTPAPSSGTDGGPARGAAAGVPRQAIAVPILADGETDSGYQLLAGAR